MSSARPAMAPEKSMKSWAEAEVLMIAHLRGRVASTDPVLEEAVQEFTEVGYLTAPDAGTLAFTARGYDAVQRPT